MGEHWTLILVVSGWSLFFATLCLLVSEIRSASAWKRRADEAAKARDAALTILEHCAQLIDIGARAIDILRGCSRGCG